MYSVRFLIISALIIVGLVFVLSGFLSPEIVRVTLQTLAKRDLYALYGTIIGSTLTICASLYVMGWSAQRQRERELELVRDAAHQIESAMRDKQWDEVFDDDNVIRWTKEHVASGLQLVISARETLTRFNVGSSLKSFAALTAFNQLEKDLETYRIDLMDLRDAVLEVETQAQLAELWAEAKPLRLFIERAAWRLGLICTERMSPGYEWRPPFSESIDGDVLTGIVHNTGKPRRW